jgi:hypothetical protein
MYLSVPLLFNLKRKSSLFLLIPLIAFAAVALASWQGGFTWSKSKLAFGFAHELPLTAVGLCLFGFGFKELRKKRLIEDTPTSRVRSAAMGFCELAGLARAKTLLTSPLSGTGCVCYRYKTEEEKRGSKGRRYWATIKEGCSTEYFYLEDATGKMLVDPMNAELLLIQDYQKITDTGGVFSRRYRYTEWYLCPGDYVYVLGTVKKFKDAALQRREALTERLRKLKADKERLMAFDTDKDGQISPEEWDAARQKMEEEMLAEDLQRPLDDTDDLVITGGTGEKTFLIADRDERDITGTFLMKSLCGGIGGAAIALLMFASMLARLGVLSKLPPIPWEMFYR